MILNKSTEKLLVDMYKNEENLSGYLTGLFRNADAKEDRRLRDRLAELKECKMCNIQWADNIPYVATLTYIAEDYIEENDLVIHELSNSKMNEMLRDIQWEFDFAHISFYSTVSSGISQIGFEQSDELEWNVKFEALDKVKVKKATRKFDEEMMSLGYVQIKLDDDDFHPRFKRYLTYAHKSTVEDDEKVTQIDFENEKFGRLYFDLISSCSEMLQHKPSTDGSEDDKTVHIRGQLTARGYDALDQTLRGKSAEGKKSGEVDLLILDDYKRPFCVIEALCLNSVDTNNIDSHINKITKYDAVGLQWNIVISYVTIADFDGFSKRYINYVSSTPFEYPLNSVAEVPNNQFSEMRMFTSKFIRSGKERELVHILINMPK